MGGKERGKVVVGVGEGVGEDWREMLVNDEVGK